jgi:ABC-type Fe3+/spermidine/putrescine transport system ATPase subunit
MICGLLRPDAGRVYLNGSPVCSGDPMQLRQVGICPQEILVWKQLTCLEQLEFVGEMYGIEGKQAKRRGFQLLQELDLVDKLGFRSQGPLWLAVVIGAVTSLSMIGAGLVIACFSRTATQAFLIANFPLALFMFFSGAMFPAPRMGLFTLAGRSIGLYDILPPTHAVSALNKVLTMGSGPAGVAYELSALLALSLLYFFTGVWLFKRIHLKIN